MPLEQATEFRQTSGTTGTPIYQPYTWAGPGVAVDRNVERILASAKMLEINVTDLLL